MRGTFNSGRLYRGNWLSNSFQSVGTFDVESMRRGFFLMKTAHFAGPATGFLSALFAIGATACSSGPVSVSAPGGKNGSPTGSPARTVNGGDPSGKGGSALKIFFEQVLVTDGPPDSIVAVSFLPER